MALFNNFKLPTRLWRRDYLVAAVETEEVSGRARPLSFTFLVVNGWFVTKTVHRHLDWTGQNRNRASLSKSHRDRAKAGAPRDTGSPRRGSNPGQALHRACRLLRLAETKGVPVVVHTVKPGLRALFDAFGLYLGEGGPAVQVISTAILERARRMRVRPVPWEGDQTYYLRAAALKGPLPDLRECLDEPRRPVASWIPEDGLFTANATDMLFLRQQYAFRPRRT
jgi:hypothetical protein